MNDQSRICDIRRMVDVKLDEVMPKEDCRPCQLHSGMRYSVLGGGKRLRAVLCMGACRAVGGAYADALMPAAALEILHAYTLVHDDLPAMDDDDLRRGKPSCHKAYGEAEAVLIGDALLTLAFEVLAQAEVPKEASPALLVTELARASGSLGVVGGQFEDVKAGDDLDDEDTLEFIQDRKTAALIRAACRLGGLVGTADDEHLRALDLYGRDLGLAFQIADDVLDETGDPESIGKPIGSDRDNHKMTSVSLYGLAGARAKAKMLIQSAHENLRILPDSTDLLAHLADMTINRDR